MNTYRQEKGETMAPSAIPWIINLGRQGMNVYEPRLAMRPGGHRCDVATSMHFAAVLKLFAMLIPLLVQPLCASLLVTCYIQLLVFLLRCLCRLSRGSYPCHKVWACTGAQLSLYLTTVSHFQTRVHQPRTEVLTLVGISSSTQNLHKKFHISWNESKTINFLNIDKNCIFNIWFLSHVLNNDRILNVTTSWSLTENDRVHTFREISKVEEEMNANMLSVRRA